VWRAPWSGHGAPARRAMRGQPACGALAAVAYDAARGHGAAAGVAALVASLRGDLPSTAARGQPARPLPGATARGQLAWRARPSSQPVAEPSQACLSCVPRLSAPGSLAHRGVLPVGPGQHPAVVVDRKATLAELLSLC
jgi:hypothetical protein